MNKTVPPDRGGRASLPLTAARAKDHALATSMRASESMRLVDALHRALARAAANPEFSINVNQCLRGLDRLRALMVRDSERSQREIKALRTALAAAYVSERRARRRALHDPLTRLPNREVFFIKLAEALTPRAAPEQVAVFYIDLDRFKAINDQHGHHIGDAVLRIVAARLTAALRVGDLVCRIGGDEFACLLLGAPDDALLGQIAAKLLDTVGAPLSVGPLHLVIRPSIGIASWPEGGRTLGTLVSNADAAMYQAKQQRCGYAFFNAASQAAFLRKAQLQPQSIDLLTGQWATGGADDAKPATRTVFACLRHDFCLPHHVAHGAPGRVLSCPQRRDLPL